MTADAGKLEASTVRQVNDLVQIGEGAIVSRTLMRTDGGNLTAFAFDAGQSLSEHTAPFDALVHVVEGQLVVTIDGTEYEVPAGSAILMPADIPHAVLAPTPAKWLLVMLRTPKDKE